MPLISYGLIVEIHMGTASALESGFDALYNIILVLRLQITLHTPDSSCPLFWRYVRT